jgi:hypothetical protein
MRSAIGQALSSYQKTVVGGLSPGWLTYTLPRLPVTAAGQRRDNAQPVRVGQRCQRSQHRISRFRHIHTITVCTRCHGWLPGVADLASRFRAKRQLLRTTTHLPEAIEVPAARGEYDFLPLVGVSGAR